MKTPLKRLIALISLAALAGGSLFGAKAEEPTLKTGSMPVYPEVARVDGLEGIVVIEALIDESGNVFAADVAKSIHPVLDKAAIDAVSSWKFTPASIDGKAVAKVVRIPIAFSLVPSKENEEIMRAKISAVAAG